jgi:hypothetical protein
MIAWGINLGHGYVKSVAIDEDGRELPGVLFPSQVALAEGRSAGAIATATTFEAGGRHWWTGEDASLGTPRVLRGHERLSDPVFLPVLARAAYQRLGLRDSEGAYVVTGLPGSWADDMELCKQLHHRLRDGVPGAIQKVLVIAEPEALALSQLLDNNGGEVGDSRYRDGRGLVIDLGSYTDDASLLDRRRKVRDSTRTYQTGMVQALTRIKNQLSARFDRNFTLHETDQAVRAGLVQIGGGRTASLPNHWDAPINELAEQLALELRADYGNGSDLAFALLGGGGALEERKVSAIQRLYPFASVVDDPQLAIARGYARLARLRIKALAAQPATR